MEIRARITTTVWQNGQTVIFVEFGQFGLNMAPKTFYFLVAVDFCWVLIWQKDGSLDMLVMVNLSLLFS